MVSVVHIQVHSRKAFISEANTMNPNSAASVGAVWSGSGSILFKYRLPKYIGIMYPNQAAPVGAVWSGSGSILFEYRLPKYIGTMNPNQAAPVGAVSSGSGSIFFKYRLPKYIGRRESRHQLSIMARSYSDNHKKRGVQWLSGRVFDSRPKSRGFEPHRHHCVVSLSKNINPSLVLVQPRQTRPFITERLLMGCKESNQAKALKNVISWQ